MHTPSNAHSRLCREASSGWKKTRGDCDGSFRGGPPTLPKHRFCGSLSPLPPQQGGSHGGLSCLSMSPEGRCPQHSAPSRTDGKWCGVGIGTIPRVPVWGRLCPCLVIVLHTRLSSHPHACSSQFPHSSINKTRFNLY